MSRQYQAQQQSGYAGQQPIQQQRQQQQQQQQQQRQGATPTVVSGRGSEGTLLEATVNITPSSGDKSITETNHRNLSTPAAKNDQLIDSLLHRFAKRTSFQTRLLTEAMCQQERILQLPQEQKAIPQFRQYHLAYLKGLKSPIQGDMEVTKPLQALQTRTLMRAGADMTRFDPGRVEVEEQYDVTVNLHTAPELGGLLPYPFHDPAKDAKDLRRALRFWIATGDKTIITIIGSRTYDQRIQTAQSYNAFYKRDLAEDLAKSTSGNYRRVIKTLMMSPEERDAYFVYKSIRGIGTDDSALVELLCTRTKHQIKLMKGAYLERYGNDLESDVRGDTSGDYQRLLVAILQAERDESLKVNTELAYEDARKLFDAGEMKRLGTDETAFIEVFTTRSFPHLRATFEFYEKIQEFKIEKSIAREMSRGLKNGLITIARAARSAPAFLADQLYKAMHGLGTNDMALVRIVTTRSEHDLLDIEAAYFKKYGTSLQQKIRKELSGHYLKLILQVFGDGAFDADVDAKKLKKAFGHRWGTSERAINRVTSSRTNRQRLLIRKAFEINYQADLLLTLESETSGDYSLLLQGAYVSPPQFAAFELFTAMELGTNEACLIEVLGSSSPKELEEIKESFQRSFGQELVNSVGSEVSGDFKNLLMALLSEERPKDEEVELEIAREEAGKLYRALERQFTDEEEVINILTGHGTAMLAEIATLYTRISDYDLVKTLKRKTSGNFKKALVALVRLSLDAPSYFAERLHKAMSGLGTDDRTVVRIMLMRSEKDLAEISLAYFEEYQLSLEAALSKEASGHYKEILIKFVERARVRPQAEAQEQARAEADEKRRQHVDYPQLLGVGPDAKLATAEGKEPGDVVV